MMSFGEIERIVKSTSMFYKQTYGNYTLFSYHYIDPTIYEKTPIAREIRGIVFDLKTKKIVLRPFPKFFNFKEPLCTLDPKAPAIANEKFDGSLVSTSYYNGEIIVASKGSLRSWVVEKAKPFILNNKNYSELMQDLSGRTVMFEMLDPKKPIVIQPKRFQLTLIGIRNNKTGKLISPLELQEIGKQYDVPVTPVKYKDITLETLERIVKPLKGLEGVVAYADNDMCKIKTSWYFSLHKYSTMATKKNVLKWFINNELDDVYGLLPEPVKQQVDSIVKNALKRIDNTVRQVEEFFKTHSFKNRKELALFLQQSNIDKQRWWIYFKVFEGTPVKQAVFEYYKKQWSKL